MKMDCGKERRIGGAGERRKFEKERRGVRQ